MMKRKPFNPNAVPAPIPLDSVSVASPCHADWDKMQGDERARFCPSCAKNVYNLSAMTAGEAQLLLQEKEGRLCIRFFQREDGTMLTADCPVGAAALKERSPAFALWAGVLSLVVLLVAATSPALLPSANAQPETEVAPSPATTQAPVEIRGEVSIAPTATPTATPLPTQSDLPRVVMGDMMAPTPAPRMGKIAPPTPPTATPAPVPLPQLFLGAMRQPQPPARFAKSKRKAGSTHHSDLESGFALHSGTSKSK